MDVTAPTEAMECNAISPPLRVRLIKAGEGDDDLGHAARLLAPGDGQEKHAVGDRIDRMRHVAYNRCQLAYGKIYRAIRCSQRDVSRERLDRYTPGRSMLL